MKLIGNLCTTADYITEDIRCSHLECGDAVIITNAGAYAVTILPAQFFSLDKSKEFFLTVRGSLFGTIMCCLFLVYTPKHLFSQR